MSLSFEEAFAEYLKTIQNIVNVNSPSLRLKFFVKGIKQMHDVDGFIYKWLLTGNHLDCKMIREAQQQLDPFEAHYLNRSLERLVRSGKIERKAYDAGEIFVAYEKVKKAPNWESNFSYVIADPTRIQIFRGFVPPPLRPNAYLYN